MIIRLLFFFFLNCFFAVFGRKLTSQQKQQQQQRKLPRGTDRAARDERTLRLHQNTQKNKAVRETKREPATRPYPCSLSTGAPRRAASIHPPLAILSTSFQPMKPSLPNPSLTLPLPLPLHAIEPLATSRLSQQPTNQNTQYMPAAGHHAAAAPRTQINQKQRVHPVFFSRRR